MMMLGVVDVPGGFLNKPPYPKHIEDLPKPYKITRPDEIKYGEVYPGPHLGYPQNPDDLLVDEKGNPVRIDWAYSWWFPLTAHGLIHNVIPAAYQQNPYGIEVLMIYMANMAWNSSQNIPYILQALTATDPAGNYIIPRIITIDAFYSEQVAYSDLVLPDATYLEQWFALSLLDRPPSAVDGPVDAIRHPIIDPKANGYDVLGWGDVMVELGSRLKLPGFVNPDGSRKYKDFKDFLINWQIRPGVGALAGWRGKNGDKHFVGEPNPNQLEMYIKNKGFFYYKLPENMRFYRHVNKDYQEWAVSVGFLKKVAPIVFNFYLETLQTFRLAGQGLWEGKNQPPNDPILRDRLVKYFDPLPFWHPPFEEEVSGKDYPLYAFTQRPQWMYHSWDSQNAWLRQISTRNYLYMNPKTAEKLGI
jgi:anaerobic selenocysteine-containing dehydrogenase